MASYLVSRVGTMAQIITTISDSTGSNKALEKFQEKQIQIKIFLRKHVLRFPIFSAGLDWPNWKSKLMDIYGDNAP